MSTKVYTTRTEAITREIIEAIEATGVVEDAHAGYDIDAIADEVLGDYEDGYAPTVTHDEFWDAVAKHDKHEA